MQADKSDVRVLLVDDDAKMVALVQGILTDDGYDVVGATTSTEALASLDDIAPDVVVLDQVMPDREGLDVADEIRDRRPCQPVVIFSSLFDHRLSIQTRRLGYVYCEKADGIARLEQAIEEALQQQGA